VVGVEETGDGGADKSQQNVALGVGRRRQGRLDGSGVDEVQQHGVDDLLGGDRRVRVAPDAVHDGQKRRQLGGGPAG
jgi:hypothetical protein